jgi:hypothetical protein
MNHARLVRPVQLAEVKDLNHYLHYNNPTGPRLYIAGPTLQLRGSHATTKNVVADL